MAKSAISLREALGFAVRARRACLKLSQEGLADIAQLHRTYVGSVERGERNISLENIEAIATALGSTASELISEAEYIRKLEATERESST